jgi:hypothetical protein
MRACAGVCERMEAGSAHCGRWVGLRWSTEIGNVQQLAPSGQRVGLWCEQKLKMCGISDPEWPMGGFVGVNKSWNCAKSLVPSGR